MTRNVPRRGSPPRASGVLLGGRGGGLGGGAFGLLRAPGGELLAAARLFLAAPSGILGGRHGARTVVQARRDVTGVSGEGAMRPSPPRTAGVVGGSRSPDSICRSHASILPSAGPTQADREKRTRRWGVWSPVRARASRPGDARSRPPGRLRPETRRRREPSRSRPRRPAIAPGAGRARRASGGGAGAARPRRGRRGRTPPRAPRRAGRRARARPARGGGAPRAPPTDPAGARRS